MNAPPPSATDRPDPIAFGPFVLDAAEARLLHDGRPVALVGRPLQVLEVLARRAGRLVSKDELLDAVWGHRHVTESVLKVALNGLRAALGDDARAPRYVETVPRRGFRFVAETRTLARAAAATAPVTPAAADAAGRAEAPADGNLPPPRPGLVGRHADHEQLLQLIKDHRLVTVTGLGGMGKTRLALDVAGHEPPPDGAWLVRLDVLPSSPDSAPARQALLATMAAGLPVPPGAAAGAAALGRALAPLALRVVLDNAEHVAELLAAVLAELLATAPRLHVLVTSQRALRLADEQVMPLAPLALPAPGATAEGGIAPDPSRYAAGRLLCDRLARLQPGWQARPEDWADIAGICRTLDGVPLAIELAAARVPLLGLTGVRERLAAPLALLTRSASDSQARHRSLAAALAWTFGLLGEGERRALQQLAVFVGGFSVAAAEHVLARLAGEEALDLLQNLQDRSLLVVEPAASGPRLRLFDSVRQHALAAAAADGSEVAARRIHAEWAEARALELEALEATVPQLRFLPQAADDIDNLRAALHFGLGPQASADDPARTARTAIALVMVWSRLGQYSDAMGWFARLRAAGLERWPGLLSAEAARAWGTLAMYAQNIPVRDALEALLAARAVLGDGGPPRRAFMARYAECAMHMRLGDVGSQRQALQSARSLVEPGWTLLQTSHLDWAELLLVRDEGRVEEYWRRCVAQARELRAVGARAEAWVREHAQGQAAFVLGRVDEACEVLHALVQDIADAHCLHAQAPVVAMAAVVHLRRDAGERALALTRMAARLLQAQGMLWWMADALPWAAWHRGRHDDARRIQAWADGLVQARADRRGLVFAALRAQFEAVAGTAPPPQPHALDERSALELALAGADGPAA